MFGFGSMEPFELVIIATILSIVISDDKEADDLNELGNFLALLGGLLQTIAGQKELLATEQENKKSRAEILRQIKDLQEKYHDLDKHRK